MDVEKVTQCCRKCGEIKPLNAFQFRKDKRGGKERGCYRTVCRTCVQIKTDKRAIHYTPEQETHILELYAQGYGVPQIVTMTGYSKKSKMSRFIMQQGVSRTGKELHARAGEKMVGKRFGKLVLLSRTVVNEKSIWKCKCDCGNEIDVAHGQLVGGDTKSCGCLRRQAGPECRFWKGFGQLSGYLFGRYKKGAEMRNLVFDITLQDAWSVFERQGGKCAFTGIPLTFAKTSNRSEGTASLDRIDSSKGYTLDNIQWVHKWLNIFKKDLTDEELFIITKAIYEYRQLQNFQSVSIENCLTQFN